MSRTSPPQEPKRRRASSRRAAPLAWIAALAAPGCAEPPPGARACNGDPALCDRPFDQIAFPMTHNAMSNAVDEWIYPNQQYGISLQLHHGIRAMMLDTYEWEDDLWLCHGYCELGATPLVEGLAEIEAFLAERPNEVISLILQDAISAEQTEAAMAEAGLLERTYAHDADAGWPTLGEMIDADQRVLVTAEVGGPPPEWYHHAWDLIWDTPYSFSDPSEFSCALNRGAPENDLFLMNHWISDPLPDPENAAEVNRAEVLQARAEACWAEAGQIPNFVAVDFYATGDLLRVVDALNGL